jgi:signal transduction histidine kinase
VPALKLSSQVRPGPVIAPYERDSRPPRPYESIPPAVAAVLGVAAVALALIVIQLDALPYVTLDPVTFGIVESAASLALIFGGLTLFFLPDPGLAQRMKWVGFGLVTLGAGSLLYDYVSVHSTVYSTLDERLYASALIRIAGTGLMAVGLVARRCPALTLRRAAGITAGVIALWILVPFSPGLRPALGDPALDDLTQLSSRAVIAELSAGHWILSIASLTLIAVVLARLLLLPPSTRTRTWLVIAMSLLAGSHLHNMLWPSIYSPITTTADVLRSAFAAVVLVGAVLELRNIAEERHAHLTEARDRNRRLTELDTLRDDFCRIVAHELGNPLAAVARMSDLLQDEQATVEEKTRLITGIQHEALLLGNLVADVQAAAAIEQEVFRVNLRPVAIERIADDAATFARTLPDLKVIVTNEAGARVVRADPERIAQVMRNLLSNAEKFTPPGTTVEIRVTDGPARVRVAVSDNGPGIHPRDQSRILERFERGQIPNMPARPGLGLGLFVCRRILQLHGSDLRVASAPGEGSTFDFDLAAER